jgi:hypothetical protein
MKTITPAKELASLQWELNNCRQTVLFLEDSIRHTEDSIDAKDPRRESMQALKRTVTEKDKQLRVIEEMLTRQKVMMSYNKPEAFNQTELQRKAIDNRMHVHKQDLKEVKDYYYHLIEELKVA